MREPVRKYPPLPEVQGLGRENGNMVRFGDNRSGFSIIEIIAVLIIIGILSAVALSRIPSTQSYEAASEVDILKMNLRYAKLRALSDDKPWGISFESGGGGGKYTLLRDGNIAPYDLPNENSPTHPFPSGMDVSGAAVTFDEWGSPGASNVEITVTPGGPIIITKNTGFIP